MKTNVNSYNHHILLAPPPLLPPPPPGVQGLCSNVVWYRPEVSREGIDGYDVRLYHPQSAHQNVTRRVGVNGTFYIVKDEDRLINNHTGTLVQVELTQLILN